MCTHTHTQMATKTISIMKDAYNMLASLKKKDESFSDVIRELAMQRKGNVKEVLKCAGILNDVITDEDAEDIKRNILKYRKGSTKKLLEKVGNL